MPLDRLDGGIDRIAVRVAVNQHGLARRAAQQLIDGNAKRLALDVPQRRVDGRDRGHRDRAAPPVGAFVEKLPDVLDAACVTSDEQRQDVIGQVAGDGELAAVERRVAEPVQAILGLDFHGDEVAPRTARDDPGVRNLHGEAPADSEELIQILNRMRLHYMHSQPRRSTA